MTDTPRQARESYREGLARALAKVHDYGDWETLDWGSGRFPAWEVYLPDADACLTYLRSRHVFLPEVLAEIKAEKGLGE